uniref:Uncharacterized protein n=1 Tax=Anopheles atroparvus TaxID=41427 RepID=A0AAG5DAK4_ANOAO
INPANQTQLADTARTIEWPAFLKRPAATDKTTQNHTPTDVRDPEHTPLTHSIIARAAADSHTGAPH